MAASAVALLGYNFVLSLHILWARCPEPYSRYWANRVGQIRGPKGLVKQREVQGWMFIDAQLDGSTGAEYWTAVGAHRLVLAAWERSGYRREGLTVDHRDQVRDHNWIDNLRWATAREQALNRIKSGASWRVFEVEQRHIVSKALIKVWANDEAAAKWAGVSIADFMDAVANKRVLKRCLWTELSEKGLQHGRYRPAVIPPPCRPSRKRAVEAAPHANKRKRHNLEVSDTGIFRVHTVKGMEILPRYNRDGYCYVTYEGERLCCARVVAATYLKERLRPGSIVRHRNGDKTDDSVGNLYVKHCYLRKRRAP